MTDPRPTRAVAALPAGQKPRSTLPSLDHHLNAERLEARHGAEITRATVSLFDFNDLRRSQGFRDFATRQLADIPPAQILARVAEDVAAAVGAKPDRTATQAAVAVLFDSRARAPQNPVIYLDALVYDLLDEGFAPAVVVAACQQLRREATFMPEIAEVLAACRKKAARYRSLASLAHRLLEDRVNLEERLMVSKPEPAPAPRAPANPNAQPGDLDW